MSEYEYLLNVVDVYIPVQDFSSALCAMMAIQNLTNEKLGQQLGVHRETVRHWTTGMQSPRDENLNKLCELLGIDENIAKMLIEREKKSKEEKS